MLGFDTIGNATVTVFDNKPILSTDPWITGDAYFGSWFLPFEIPQEQRQNIINSEYIWISHGHPDHLSGDSLKELTGCKFLLCDHVGERIADGLRKKGFNVTILPDRKWVQLSENVKVMGLSDYVQDSILLVDVNGVLLVNTNDAQPMGNMKFMKKIISQYKHSVLLKLFGYGDVDMLNCYEEDGTYIKSTAHYNKEKGAVGPQIKFWSELYGVTKTVPFSCFHDYQRSDSIWAREITTPLKEFYNDFESETVELLPYYIRYNTEDHTYKEINPKQIPLKVKSPEHFNDSWSDELSNEDIQKLTKYFNQFDELKKQLDYIQFQVGTKTHTIDFREISGTRFNKGINFHTPRNSLMSCVDWEIFDDLLIGNYMKTTFLGDWKQKNLSVFNTYVGKIGDNGLARTEDEVKRYFKEYAQRAPIEFLAHRIGKKSEQTFRSFVNDQSPLFTFAKKIYSIVNK